jgi:hypothetical protein
MIVDVLYMLAGSVLNMIYAILSLITFVIPNEIETSLVYLFDNFRYIQPFWPVADTFVVVAFLIQFLIVWFTIQLAFKLLGFLPFVKKTKPQVTK